MKKSLFLVLALLVMVLVLASGCSSRTYPGGNFAWGQDVDVASGQVHEGDLVVTGGNARIREGGRVTGNLVVMGGSTQVAGQVDGNMTVWGGDVRLADTAVVRGNMVSYGGNISRAPGAQVLGQATGVGSGGPMPPQQTTPSVGTSPWSGPWVGSPYMGTYNFMDSGWGFLRSMFESLIAFLAVAALGILIIAFLPKNLPLVQRTATEMWPISLGVGFLTLLVALLVTIVLLIPAIILIVIGGILTALFIFVLPAIIGIPLILIGVLLLFVPAGLVAAAVLLGWTVIAQYVGERVMAVVNRPSNAILSFLVGLVLISLLSAVPCIGWVLALGLICIALGAVVLSRAGTVLPPQIAERESEILPVPVTEEAPMAPVEPPAEQ
jgi:hypothetical protein